MPDYAGTLIDEPIIRGVVGYSADANAPVISNQVPAAGSQLDSRLAPIQFDVTDESGLGPVYIEIRYGSGLWESAYMAGEVAPLFAPRSTITPIANGLRFVLYRVGGWPSDPNIAAHAIDTDGNVA